VFLLRGLTTQGSMIYLSLVYLPGCLLTTMLVLINIAHRFRLQLLIYPNQMLLRYRLYRRGADLYKVRLGGLLACHVINHVEIINNYRSNLQRLEYVKPYRLTQCTHDLVV
jgi:hypothetical protein